MTDQNPNPSDQNLNPSSNSNENNIIQPNVNANQPESAGNLPNNNSNIPNANNANDNIPLNEDKIKQDLVKKFIETKKKHDYLEQMVRKLRRDNETVRKQIEFTEEAMNNMATVGQ